RSKRDWSSDVCSSDLLAPTASGIVAFVGIATALFAATMALVTMDIKQTLAYSTVSQLGYMVFAVGLGAYTAGIFHLVTHAFFKEIGRASCRERVEMWV